MRVALYARVSTTKRKDSPAREYEQDPALQLQPMRDYCARNKWVITGPVDEEFGQCYFDRASGADPSRPAFRKMMEDAGKRKFDAVMCWKFDRVSRGAIHLLQILDALHANGVDFISVTENLDTTTPAGRMVFGMIAVVAQFEREMIQERVRAGMKAARDKGIQFGRPRVAVPVLLLQEDIQAGMSLLAACQKRGVAYSTGKRALEAYQADSPKVAQ